MRHYLNDAKIRSAFRPFLQQHYLLSDEPAIILEELGLRHGRARIDLAVVNGEFMGFEFKSDLDSLRRLPEQIMVYNSVFDKISLIVTERHLSASIEQLFVWWGVILAGVTSTGKVLFREVRKPQPNPRIEKVAVARLLWRTEALGILEECGAAEGFRSKPRGEIYTRLAELLDDGMLRAKVRQRLSLRTVWRPDALQMSGGD